MVSIEAPKTCHGQACRDCEQTEATGSLLGEDPGRQAKPLGRNTTQMYTLLVSYESNVEFE